MVAGAVRCNEQSTVGVCVLCAVYFYAQGCLIEHCIHVGVRIVSASALLLRCTALIACCA